MFYQSNFDGDISKWDVSNVEDMSCMFADSEFNGDISNWDVSKVEYMFYTFLNSKFNKDISNWKINKDCDTTDMFTNCYIKQEYKPVLPE